MEWTSCVQRLINHTLEKGLCFQKRLEELGSVSYASDAPITLINLFSDLNSSIHLELIRYNRTFSATQNNQIHEGLFYKIQSLSAFLAELYQLVSPVEFSRTIRNPVSVSLPIESFAKELVPDAFVLVYPNYTCNYSYLDILSEKYLRSQYYSQFFPPKLFKKYPKHFVLLGFPDLLRNNILCHATIGHELGHLIAQHYNICSKVREKISQDDYLDISLEQLETFLEEYVADIISIDLFGPAAFFALAEFGGSMRRFEEPSATHPPLYLRFKNMLSAMKDYNHWQFFVEERSNGVENEIAKKMRCALETWEKAVKTGYEMLESSPSGCVFNILSPALKEARRLVKQKIDKRFQLELPDKMLEYTESLIKNGIPPSGDLNLTKNSCERVQLGVILNAAWLFKVWQFEIKKELRSRPQAIKYARKFEDLSRLTQKAIEQSETIKWYHKERE